MANYGGYQAPQYMSAYVSPNFEALQRYADAYQGDYDKTMMQFANAGAGLNEIPTYSPEIMQQARKNFEEGFYDLYARTGGDASAHYLDYYRYLMNAKSDPVYNLNKLQYEAMEQAKKLKV